MILQSTWKCRRGTILGVLRSFSNRDTQAPKTITIDLLDFGDSPLGRVIFQRLCSQISSSRIPITQSSNIGALPACLVLPPPPSKALPSTKKGGAVIQEQLTHSPVAVQGLANHNIADVHPLRWIRPAIWLNFNIYLWMSRLYDALSLRSRMVRILMSQILQWVTQALGAGQPPLQPGMTRVKWKCVCISGEVSVLVENCSGLTYV